MVTSHYELGPRKACGACVNNRYRGGGVQVVFFWHNCSYTHTHEAGQLTRFDSSCAVLCSAVQCCCCGAFKFLEKEMQVEPAE
jgi:hypothetical protein